MCRTQKRERRELRSELDALRVATGAVPMRVRACQGRGCGTRMATGVWRVTYAPQRLPNGQTYTPEPTFELLCAECGFKAHDRRSIRHGTVRQGTQRQEIAWSVRTVERVDLLQTLRV